MAKTEQIAVRLDPATKAALAKAADADRRSISAMVEKIVVDWLRRHSTPTKARAVRRRVVDAG